MFKWPDSATSPGSWHVAACGAAGRVTGASRPRDGARRTRRLDVFPSPPVRLHTRKRHTAPSVASGGDGARRRGPGQHRGVDGARGGCCGPFRGPGDLPRAARTLPGQRERQIGPSGAKTLIQTSDGGARPLRAGQDLPRLLAGACGRPSPEDTQRGTGSCSAFTCCATQPDADPQNHLWSAARRGDARAPLRGPDYKGRNKTEGEDEAVFVENTKEPKAPGAVPARAPPVAGGVCRQSFSRPDTAGGHTV